MKIENKELLNMVSKLHEIPEGAHNIRQNGKLVSRANDNEVTITPKKDKDGIDIYVKANTKNKSLHLPVLITESGLHDVVYNDFYIGENCDITIVAGCGIHNSGDQDSQHDGIHTFHIGENSTVKYIERHVGIGDKAKKILNPITNAYIAKGATLNMETVQIGGVSNSIRKTYIECEDNATLLTNERILTEEDQYAETEFEIVLKGTNSKGDIISRSVAKGNSKQIFSSKIIGNNACFGHVECDAFIFDSARVTSVPAIEANHNDALLTHEAVIGKIAGEQLIKLMTLGLTKEEAENEILSGFLGVKLTK